MIANEARTIYLKRKWRLFQNQPVRIRYQLIELSKGLITFSIYSMPSYGS